MEHGYLKPSPPYLTTRGYPSTFLLPSESIEIDITPFDLGGKIHPGSMNSEFGAYKIIGRGVSVKRFLHENASARIFTKGNQKIVVSSWTYDKNAKSKELEMVQTGVGLAKTLGGAMKSNMTGGMVGSGIAVKAGLNSAKMVYDHFNTKEIDLDKVPSDPDGTKFKRFMNALKQAKDTVGGTRTAVLISVLAPPPGVANKYDTGLDSVSFSNVLAVLKGF